jgi:hypothetical protein
MMIQLAMQAGGFEFPGSAVGKSRDPEGAWEAVDSRLPKSGGLLTWSAASPNSSTHR